MMRVRGKIKRATLEATIIRADGTREPLGLIGYASSNPLKRLVVNLYLAIKRRRRK